MIINYQQIGRIKMKQDGFDGLNKTGQRLYFIRQFCEDDSSFAYKPKGSEETHYGRIIQMNLNTQEKSICFQAGPELGTGAAEKYLVFRNFAPSDSNFYATHIGYKSIFSFGLGKYMEKEQKKIDWIEPDKLKATLESLQRLKNDFFLEEPALHPKYDFICNEQQTDYPGAEEADKSDSKTFDKAIEKYFKNQIYGLSEERRAFALCIDGKFVHEIEELAPFYIDVLFYHILDKQFTDSKNKGFCHLCGKEALLSKTVALNQKFYGATNPYFFDSVSAPNNKNAFAMCKECYMEVAVGSKHAAKYFGSRFLGLDLITLPEPSLAHVNEAELIQSSNMQIIPRLLRFGRKSVMKDNWELIQRMRKHLNKFSFFFWNKPSATSQIFIINQMIKGISFNSLVQKSENLDELAEQACLERVLSENYNLSFEGLRFMLLPSKDSHPNLKISEYQKINREILALLSSYLYSQKIPYKNLIKMYVDIHARKRNNLGERSDYELNLSAFIMSLYIKHYIAFNLISGIKTEEEKNMTTTLEKAELKEYFANNAAMYENNYPAQGLFILGTYISDIEREQKGYGSSDGKTPINKTAITKLNLRGIPLPKVMSVMATIDDLRGIWVKYQDPVLDAYYRECMTHLPQSSLSPEEIVFHILAGRSYQSYLAIMHKKNQEINKQNQEVQND
ncbi:MAG: TM1802 family CRISPR-associated protein [Candidatus Cloacimonetes bacterium]|nr:TM1802 family CRISPR-associated protein [Candidatus Cloacimonadota bacterium]